MSDPHLLTGAYALDALPDDERAGVERHLRSCPECAAEVAEFREVGGWLAGRVAATPPSAMKNRVLALARDTRQESPPSGNVVRLPQVGPRRLLLTAAAVVVLAGGVGLGGVAWDARQDADQARLQATRITDLVTDPDRRESAGQVAGGGTATVMAADGSAVISVADLPPLPADKTYQLWRLDSGDVDSMGLLTVEDGVARAYVEDAPPGSSLAISVEPEGGSEQPTTTPITNVPVA